MGQWVKLGMWLDAIALELLSLSPRVLLITTGAPAAEQCRGGGAPVLAPQPGQLGTQHRLTPLLLGWGWLQQPRWQWRLGGRQCQAPAWLCAQGNGCGWPWGRQTGLWEGAMPRRSTLPSWQGWEPPPAPGDSSDSSSHPTLSCPSTQGCGTAGVCMPPFLAPGAGSG